LCSIVGVIAPLRAVGVEGVLGKVIVILTILQKFLQVVVHELFPKLTIDAVEGFVLEAKVADE
jgi:hypothetical protein